MLEGSCNAACRLFKGMEVRLNDEHDRSPKTGWDILRDKTLFRRSPSWVSRPRKLERRRDRDISIFRDKISADLVDDRLIGAS